MSLSDYFADVLLKHIVGLDTYTMPSWIYMGLGVGSVPIEVLGVGTGYTRFASQPSLWSAASGGEIHNTTAAAFPEATGDWGLITSLLFYDTGTVGTGNLLMTSTLTTPRQIVTGSLPKFAISAISVSEVLKFSDYWENKLLDHIFGKASLTAPSNIFVALSSTNPLDSGAGITEPSGMSYARVSTSSGDWTLVLSRSFFNNTAITFPTASGEWGTMNWCALFDAASGGNMLAFGALSTSKSIGVGQVAKFSAYPPAGNNLILNFA